MDFARQIFYYFYILDFCIVTELQEHVKQEYTIKRSHLFDKMIFENF